MKPEQIKLSMSDAIINLMRDAKNKRQSRTSCVRVRKSLAALGITPVINADCFWRIMHYLDYAHPDGFILPRYRLQPGML